MATDIATTTTMTADVLDRLRRELAAAQAATEHSRRCGDRAVLAIHGLSEDERQVAAARYPELRTAEQQARLAVEEAERAWAVALREQEITALPPRSAEAARQSDEIARQIAARSTERRRLHAVVNAFPSGDPFAILDAERRLKAMAEDGEDRRLDLALRQAERERQAIEQAERAALREQFARDKGAALAEIRKALTRATPAYQRLRAIEAEEALRCGGIWTSPLTLEAIIGGAWEE